MPTQAQSLSEKQVQLLGPKTAGEGAPLSRQMWCRNPGPVRLPWGAERSVRKGQVFDVGTLPHPAPG